ncbi:hypothetical protein BDA96_01G154300 [Sorghum bicolor]|uniref:LOB domain-containing protein n=1 Tax=Sorghum bicolor TaxID=4558 RepID=A0A921UYP8_SORBI|nr:LOB domain-containing protein 4 isoform X2 [Sorghum bicolor]KAG0548290.1 hypothetical protein BDA96_01G154300 [Sorghum bicolor]|eukprot:XP_021316812.1 LOB domain-containing protein 4 isoform X2 [Sorghum bicolor]
MCRAVGSSVLVLPPLCLPTAVAVFTPQAWIAHGVRKRSFRLHQTRRHEIPVQHRGDAVSSLVYEANARVRDPVYGCVGAISSLQQQVETLQAQLALAQAEMVRLRMSNDYILHRLKAASRANGGGGSSYTGSPSSMSSPKTAEPEAHCNATPELLDMVVDQPSMDDAHFWSY